MAAWLDLGDLRHFLIGEDADEGLDAIRLTDAIEAAMEQVEHFTGTDWDDEDDLPASVRQATLLQAARLYKRHEASFGIATVGTADGGTGMRLLNRMDPDAEELLKDWRSGADI